MNNTEPAPIPGRGLPFPAVLQHWRVKLQGNKPIKQVADDFDIAESTWSRWENGLRFPAPEQIQPLADFLKIPPCRFFCPPDWQCPRCIRHGE